MCAQSSKNPRPNVNQHITDKLEVSIMCFSAILFSLEFFHTESEIFVIMKYHV